MDKIEKKSIGYSLLFYPVKWFYYLYYRKVIITGKAKIPVGQPIIFAANHQNALMDALAILMAANRPVVFLSRADIFTNKRIARILNFLRMMPVYRLRDGFDSMGKNQESFVHTARVLKSGTPLAILPEGVYSPKKRLLPLKKGICRIAFQTAETSGFTMNIFIVPIGIDYTAYQKAGTELVINYGDPIAISNYYADYQSNPQKAINSLRDQIARALKEVMIHTEDEGHYHLIHALAETALSSYLTQQKLSNNRYSRFQATQKLIALIGKGIESGTINIDAASRQTEAYQRQLNQYGLKDWLFELPLPNRLSVATEALLWLAGSPLFLYGLAINYLPYSLPGRVARKMKDKQFVSSVNIALGLILFPIWHLILLVICLISGMGAIASLMLLVSWVIGGIFAFYHARRFKKLSGKYRLWQLLRKQKSVYRQMAEERKKIIQTVLAQAISNENIKQQKENQ